MGYWIEKKVYPDVVVEQGIVMGEHIIRHRKYHIVRNDRDVIQKVVSMCEKHDLYCEVSKYNLSILCKPKEFPSIHALYNYIDKKFVKTTFSLRMINGYVLIRLSSGKKLTYRISKNK